MIVYVNGQYLPYSEAKVGIEDRGFQFGDGVYEAVRVYAGEMFRMGQHMERLERSAREIGLSLPDTGGLTRDAQELLRLNDSGDAVLYIEATRGVCPRKHLIPCGIEPTVVMTARETPRFPAEYRQNGVKAITVPDERWARCYIKSVNLLPNILAKQKAERSGAYEAIFIRDGEVTEGASSNVFIVESGALVTPPLTRYILAGVTRETVMQLADTLGISCRTEVISADRLSRADEVWVTATITEMMPVVDLDGASVGEGRPGPVFRKMYPEYVALYSGGETTRA